MNSSNIRPAKSNPFDSTTKKKQCDALPSLSPNPSFACVPAGSIYSHVMLKGELEVVSPHARPRAPIYANLFVVLCRQSTGNHHHRHHNSSRSKAVLFDRFGGGKALRKSINTSSRSRSTHVAESQPLLFWLSRDVGFRKPTHTKTRSLYIQRPSPSSFVWGMHRAPA